jgi:hypothetical protein
MSDAREVICRPQWTRTWWCLAGLGATAVLAAVALWASTGEPAWPAVGIPSAAACLLSAHRATARLSADAHGLHVRTLLRRWDVPWSDVADLRVRLTHAPTSRPEEFRRVGVTLRDGSARMLPQPWSRGAHDPEFDAALEALRALHRRHGTPASDHLPVLSPRTAGRGWAGSLALCVLLSAAAGVTAWHAPDAESTLRAWTSARPCAAGTPAAERADCLTTVPAVIERTDPRPPRKAGRLYFTGARPLERLVVSQEAARAFRPGDRVRLTLWRGGVRKVAGDRYVWHDHIPGGGDVVVVAAGLALAAGCPAARVLLRLRGRHRPEDEVLPSALPFAAALAVTALWLLPLAYLHPTAPLGSPATITWTTAGALTTTALLAWAWRATGTRPPRAPAPAPGERDGDGDGEDDVFVAARFLEATEYNPHHFGTHIVVGGGGPPAVVPHAGPGRYAARRIPADRLTLREVRHVRGGDGDTVPASWHIADLDDAGTPVRLAASPADLTRVLRALRTAPPRRERDRGTARASGR